MRFIIYLLLYYSLFSQSDVSLIHIESTLKTTPTDLRFDYDIFVGRHNDFLFDYVSFSYVKTGDGKEYISSNTLFSIPFYFKDNLNDISKIIAITIIAVPFLTNIKMGGLIDNDYFAIGQNTDYYFFYNKDEVYTETLISYGRLLGSVMISNTISYCWNGAYSRKKGFHYRAGIAYVFGK